MQRPHPADAILIAFLDGELAPAEREAAARHLETCWDCRLRLRNLEEQIAGLTRVFAAAAFRDSRLFGGEPAWQGEAPPRSRLSIRWILASVATTALAAASIHFLWVPGIVAPASRPGPAVSSLPVIPAPPPSKAEPVSPKPAMERAATPPVVATINLDEAEVAARYALFRAEADMSDPVEVVRAPGHVLVKGTVEPLERREALRASLAGIEGVVVELAGVEAAAESTAGYADQQVLVKALLEAEIREYASTLPGQRVTETEFRNRQIDRSMAALDHAWALRRLEEAFPQDRVARLGRTSHWLLEAMARAHIAAISERLDSLRQDLTGLLGALAADARAPVDDDLALFERMVEINRLVTWLFAARAVEPGESPAAHAGRLAAALEGAALDIARTQEDWGKRALALRDPERKR